MRKKSTSRIFTLVLCGASFLCWTSGARATDDHLLLCEAVVTPTAGEFLEIVNPTLGSVNLDNYYLSDDDDYALLPGASGAGPAPVISSSDFIVQFPAGQSIAAGQVIVVALDGAGFIATYGSAADYEIKGTDAGIPDMIATDVGGSAGLTNSGENAVLFIWDGASDLVADVDMLNIGTPTAANSIANKTGVAVDGPDVDAVASTYLNDAYTMPQQAGDPGFGFSTKRLLLEVGNEATGGGNGLTGDDETTEVITTTWDGPPFGAPNPGVCNAGGPTPTGACCNGAVCTPGQTQAVCEGGGGTWEGPDTLCSPNPCGPVGACCAADFSTCTNNLTVEQCADLDPTATWSENEFCNLACGPTGSCCLSLSGTCATDVTEAECAAMQGYQWTEGAGSCDPACVAAQQENILISEYYESAPGSRKAVELYNPGASAANLNGHALLLQFNDCFGDPGTVLLDGLTIGANDTLVIINNAADDIPGFDESQAHTDGSLNHNGDDAIELVFGDVTGVPFVIDAFGVPCQQDTGPRGINPYQDAAWERDCAITMGTANFDACNFDGLKECALAECPPGTPVGPPPCNDGTDPPEAGQWIFEGLNPSGDSDQHSLGSHLCLPGGGACCLPNDDCVITDSAGCMGMGGTFLAGMPCNPNPCGQQGSCCLTNVFCQTGVTQSQCAALDANAFFTPGGDCTTECPNEGACCLGGTGPEGPGCGTCPGDTNGDAVVDDLDVASFVAELLNPVGNACADVNGIPPVDGLDIEPFVQLAVVPTPCAGCITTTAANCANLAGDYRGDGVPCDPDPCGPLGMCCSQDFALCVDNLSAGQCAALDPNASHLPGQTCDPDCQPSIPAGLVINEFWADDGFGDTAEYIELFCPSCGGASLNGLSVLEMDGDTGVGGTADSHYKQVNNQFDLTGFTMPLDGFFVIGGGTTPNVDLAFSLGASGAIENGSQTYALVRTLDIDYDPGSTTNQLTDASVTAITANLIDGITGTDDTDDAFTDTRYFGAPVIETAFGVDTASRIPNGQDTDTGENTGGGEDWVQQDSFADVIELFDANDRLSSPGTTNSADPLGTCCNAGTCTTETVSACEGGGGTWIGRLADCSDPNANPCLPLGACCIDATTCVIANQTPCETTLAGTYQGNDTVCDPLPCGPTGSCCAADFLTCTDDLTAEECAAMDPTATWTNGGTCLNDCIAPEGACCVSNVCDDTPPVTLADCTAAGGFYLGDGSTCAMSMCPDRPCLIISEVVDGNRPGGNPKFVEITNTDVNDYTFAAGGVIVQSNASTDTTVDVDLTGVTILAGQSYVIASSANDGQNIFEDTYDMTFPGGPIVADLYTPAFFSNGDDRYAITDAADGSNILDIHGEFGVDGTGTAWEYTNGYAFRNAAANSGNLGTFFIGEWTHGGVGSLVGFDDPTDKLLLQQNTTPTTHTYVPGCSGGGGGPEDIDIELCDENGDSSCLDPGPTFCFLQVTEDGPGGMQPCGVVASTILCIACVDTTCPIAGLQSPVLVKWIGGGPGGSDCFFNADVVGDTCTTCLVGTPRFKVVMP